MSEWQKIETAPSGKIVLIHYKNSHGKSRIVKAVKMERFCVKAFDEIDYYGEWDERGDRYTYMPGWYEKIDNWGDFSAVFVNEGNPDHWMPLPEPPKDGYPEDRV